MLIALHTAGVDDSVELIEQTLKTFRKRIAKFERQLEEERYEIRRNLVRINFSGTLNAFAWLIANTQGDLDEAMRSSKRSLEMRPQSADYLDTLARCYFAKGDYANAVKHQSLAVKRRPHSRHLHRHLEMYKQKLEESERDEPREN